MRTITNLCFVVFLARAFTAVTCITNAEFFGLLMQYGEDFREIEEGDPRYVDDDLIKLPGNMTDELDIEALSKQIQDSNLMERLQFSGGCHCHHFGCSCCVSHSFSFSIIFKHIHVSFKACVDVSYIPAHRDFLLVASLMGHGVFRHEVHLGHVPKLCFNVPGFKLASVCFNFYNVNVAQKHMCVRIDGSINAIVHTFHVHIHLACFTLPGAEDVEGNMKSSLLEYLKGK